MESRGGRRRGGWGGVYLVANGSFTDCGSRHVIFLACLLVLVYFGYYSVEIRKPKQLG